MKWLSHSESHTLELGITPLVERRTRNRKATRMFFSIVNVLCWLSFGVRRTPPAAAVAWKIRKSFCQKRRWQVTPKHTYTFDPMRSGLTILSRHSVGTTQENQLTCKQGTLGHSRSSSLSHCGLILAYIVELVCLGWSPFIKFFFSPKSTG